MRVLRAIKFKDLRKVYSKTAALIKIPIKKIVFYKLIKCLFS